MKTPLAVLALTLSATLHAGALVLQPGQSVGIDFGASPPDNHFNQWNPADIGSVATGQLSSVIDTTGATVFGLGVNFAGGSAESVMGGTLQDLSHYTGFDSSNIEDAVMGYNLAMTFTGLNPGQLVTLDLVSSFSPRNLGIEFTCGTQSLLTDSTSTTGGTLAHFTNISADANGNIAITITSHDALHDSTWAGINAVMLTAQAIPEPSAGILSLVGAGSLTFFRRRRVAQWSSASLRR